MTPRKSASTSEVQQLPQLCFDEDRTLQKVAEQILAEEGIRGVSAHVCTKSQRQARVILSGSTKSLADISEAEQLVERMLLRSSRNVGAIVRTGELATLENDHQVSRAAGTGYPMEPSPTFKETFLRSSRFSDTPVF